MGEKKTALLLFIGAIVIISIYIYMLNNFFNQTNILKNGESIPFRVISEEEFDSYIKEVGSIKIQKYDSLIVYRLNNNYVVAKDGNYCSIYRNLEDLDKILVDYFENINGVFDIMYGRNPYGKTLPSNRNKLAYELFQKLNIEEKSIEIINLKKIDLALKKKSLDINQLYLPLVIYLGELLIKEKGGVWKMKLSQDGITWKPTIEYKNQEIIFYDYIYQDFITNKDFDSSIEEIYYTVEQIYNNIDKMHTSL